MKKNMRCSGYIEGSDSCGGAIPCSHSGVHEIHSDCLENMVCIRGPETHKRVVCHECTGDFHDDIERILNL
jgi:hypothetical protein